MLPQEGCWHASLPLPSLRSIGLPCNRLEARFGHLAVFFANYESGHAIGVAWRPKAFLPGPLRVAHAHTSASVGEQDEDGALVTVPDVPAILQDMAAAGEGLIESIEVRDSGRHHLVKHGRSTVL